MTKKDVKIGATYWMRHTSGRIQIKILAEVTEGYKRNLTHWRGLNLKTGREIIVKSAVKLS